MSQGNAFASAGSRVQSIGHIFGNVSAEDFENFEVVWGTPLSCGFLKLFTDKEYNSENLDFHIAVDGFKDIYPIDALQNAMEIWDDFCDDGSRNQICMSSHIEEELRAVLFKEGITTVPLSVFDSALKVAYTALEKDVFPRFKRSEIFTELKELYSNPIKDEVLNTRMSAKSILDNPKNKEKWMNDQHKFRLEDIMSDPIMFNVFETFLIKRVAAESLQCWKEIQIFRHLHTDDVVKKNRDRAFMIYFTFVVPGSEKEVSTPDSLRHSMEYELANPSKEAFDGLVNVCMVTIRDNNFRMFTESEEYSTLPQTIKEESKRRRRESLKGDSGACAVS